jgi:glycosyltransferase involved in cell wall biosynthesis
LATLNLPALDTAAHSCRQTPNVSILIPTFNRSALLAHAIESALQQTYTNHEIIVVDDGSTDDTVQVAANYRDRIRYIHQKNQGIAAALNQGIEAARGRWIAVLADDDLWLPEKLESQINAVAALGEEFGACFTNCSYVGDPARTRTTFEEASVNYPSDAGPLEEPHRYVLAKHPALFVQSMLVSRSLLQQLNGFDPQLLVGEDTDLLFRLAFLTRFCLVNEPLVQIDRTPSLPRLTNHYESPSESILSCVEYRYRKWLTMPGLTDPAIRRTIEENIQSIYYGRIIHQLRQSNLTRAFEYIRGLRKAGTCAPWIVATLFYRATRRCVSSLVGEARTRKPLQSREDFSPR